jgi:hypothetical protein
MNFKDDAVRLGAFDITALRDQAAALTDADWSADASRQQTFDAHTRTQTIKLIFDADYRHSDPTVHADFAVFEPVIRPLMDHIRGWYLQSLRQRRIAEKHGPGYFIRAILTRLAPNAEITPHADDGHSLKRCHRIHMPIVTNPDCLFTVGDRTWHMPAGELWEINNRRVHAVRNSGATARIHLIMDYVQPGETVFDIEPLTA